jgi:putative NADH-flavin reductase
LEVKPGVQSVDRSGFQDEFTHGESWVSTEDYAMAMIDEVEKPSISGSDLRWGTEVQL